MLYRYIRRCYSCNIIELTTKRSIILNSHHVNRLTTGHICKLLYIPCRYVRGIARTFDVVANREDRKETPLSSNDDDATSTSSFTGIKKSEIKDLLNNSVIEGNKPIESVSDVWSQKPYPSKYSQGEVKEEGVDPKLTSIILFPGQGSQFVGMGESLLKYPRVEQLYKYASEILGYDLLNLCLQGPQHELNKTIYCQPAVVVTSLAAVERVRDETPHVIDRCVGTAGFSVGEITALIFAGVLKFEDGIKLVRIRAEAMQAASEMVSGGMITVFYGADARIGFACEAAIEWCKRKGVEDVECNIANYLFPGCKVIAGHNEALKFIMTNAKDFGIRRYKELPVSGAFHTNLMKPAEESMRIAVGSIKMKEPLIPVYSNITGSKYWDVVQIKKKLPRQLCNPVKWEQTLHTIYERSQATEYPLTFECGPGKSLSAILQKVNGKAYERTYKVDA